MLSRVWGQFLLMDESLYELSDSELDAMIARDVLKWGESEYYKDAWVDEQGFVRWKTSTSWCRDPRLRDSLIETTLAKFGGSFELTMKSGACVARFRDESQFKETSQVVNHIEAKAESLGRAVVIVVIDLNDRSSSLGENVL